LLAGHLVYAQSSPDFELRSDEDGVRIYTREETDGQLSVRVQTRARTQVQRVRETLDAAGAYAEWVHRCDGAYIVSGGTADDYIFVSGIDMPFPFSDKEVVARIQQYQTTDGVYVRTITGDPTAVPNDRGRDRPAVYLGEWRVTPLAGGQVELMCTVRTDAGAGLPSWLRKEILTGGPARTIANLRRRLEG
jgi:hypothetical protein